MSGDLPLQSAEADAPLSDRERVLVRILATAIIGVLRERGA